MKRSNRTEDINRCPTSALRVCLDCCRKVLSQINQVKESFFAEFGNAFRSREKLLRLAVNEAEALAWETPYPHLVFPTLATEKVQEVMAWSRRQQAVRQAGHAMAFSA